MLKRGIIVSIQGYHHKTVAELAAEAIRAGAVGLRVDKPIHLPEGVERVPIIGLNKNHVAKPSEEPYVTATVEQVQQVASWADLVAVDYRNCNPTREQLAAYCKEHQIKVVADIGTMEDYEGMKDLYWTYVATTLSVFHKNHRPDLALIETLRKCGEKNIIAEGNYTTRVDVQRVLKNGAWCVCIGSAISNVYKLTRKFTTVEY